MRKVVVGGTFAYLHKGHRALLERAFEIGDVVLIGITADEFKGSKLPFEIRRKDVEKFVTKFKKPYEVMKIHDKYGPTLEEDFDVIVVSKETEQTAREINQLRRNKGHREMKIVTIPILLAEDLLPLSSRRIEKGEIDPEGHRLKVMRVNVGSMNPSKIRGVEKIFSQVFSFPMEIKGVQVEPGVPPQPIDGETVKGAINRARNALQDADYGVGIEAGLFWDPVARKYFDKAFCVIIDKYGNSTYGYSGGFVYPPQVIDMVKKGMEVGKAMEQLSGISDIGRKMGAIGYLSKGLITREEFNAQSVLMAMIPRISGDLYFEGK